LPSLHADFVARALPILAADPRIVGVAAAGSTARPETMDEHSDLDLVVAVEPDRYEEMMAGRVALARSLGPLLHAFPGDHVGAPHLLICLYGPPLLHVDLKFVPLPDAAQRVDENVVLCDDDGRLAATLADGRARYPQPDLQWMEDRLWTWVHYLGGKIARGELFEAIDGLGFIRARVLGPLALRQVGAQPNGVRRLESAAPGLVPRFAETVALPDAHSCLCAVRATIDLYRLLRDAADQPGLVRRADVEREATAFLASVEDSI
jgi:predicted nucleotidyltransferase